MVLSDDYLNFPKSKEIEARRRMRIEQVRKQSNDVAKYLRERVKTENNAILKVLDKFNEEELNKWKSKKLSALEKEYVAAVSEIGRAHRQADIEPDVDLILQEKEKENRSLAIERYKSAEIEVIKEKKLSEENVNAILRRKQLTRNIEDIRSSLVCVLPQQYGPLKFSDLIDYEKLQELVASMPPEIIATPEEKQSKSKKRTPKKAFKPIKGQEGTRAVKKVVKMKQKMATEGDRMHPTRKLEDEDVIECTDEEEEFEDEIEEKVIECDSNESFQKFCDPAAAGPSNWVNLNALLSQRSIFSKMSEKKSEKSEKKSEKSEKKSEKSEKKSEKSEKKSEKSEKKTEKSEKKPEKPEKKSEKKNYLTYNADVINTDAWASYRGVKGTKTTIAVPSKKAVDFYDYSSRYYCKDYKKGEGIVQKIEEDDSEPDACELAKHEEEEENLERKRKMGKDLKEENEQPLSPGQIRGNRALIKEKRKHEYKNLVSQLDKLYKKEKLLKAYGHVPSADVFLSDSRRQEKMTKRQREMDSKFEKIYHEAAPIVQAPVQVYMAIQDNPYDKCAPKLNVAEVPRLRVNSPVPCRARGRHRSRTRSHSSSDESVIHNVIRISRRKKRAAKEESARLISDIDKTLQEGRKLREEATSQMEPEKESASVTISGLSEVSSTDAPAVNGVAAVKEVNQDTQGTLRDLSELSASDMRGTVKVIINVEESASSTTIEKSEGSSAKKEEPEFIRKSVEQYEAFHEGVEAESTLVNISIAKSLEESVPMSASTVYRSPPHDLCSSTVGDLMKVLDELERNQDLCRKNKRLKQQIENILLESLDKTKDGKDFIQNPLLMHYILKLLGMSRRSIEALNVSSVSDISTPNMTEFEQTATSETDVSGARSMEAVNLPGIVLPESYSRNIPDDPDRQAALIRAEILDQRIKNWKIVLDEKLSGQQKPPCKTKTSHSGTQTVVSNPPMGNRWESGTRDGRCPKSPRDARMDSPLDSRSRNSKCPKSPRNASPRSPKCPPPKSSKCPKWQESPATSRLNEDKYDVISQECYKRISELTKMLEQVRKDKEKLLTSSSGQSSMNNSRAEKSPNKQLNKSDATESSKSRKSEEMSTTLQDFTNRYNLSPIKSQQALSTISEADSQLTQPNTTMANSSLDSSLPNVMEELIKRKILSSPFRWSEGSRLSDKGDLEPVEQRDSIQNIISNFRKEMEEMKQLRQDITLGTLPANLDEFLDNTSMLNLDVPSKNEPETSRTTGDHSTSSHPSQHCHCEDSSSENMDHAFSRMGLNWARALLKKNEESKALSTSSNSDRNRKSPTARARLPCDEEQDRTKDSKSKGKKKKSR